MISLYRALRADRLLSLLTLLLGAASLVPLLRASIVPLMDLPHHAAAGGLMWDVVRRQPVASHHYWIDPTPVPYWTAYVMLAVAERLLGVYAGTKAVVAIVVLSVPLGAMRLCLALGKSPRLGLGAFLLAWDFNLYFGWINHVLAVGLALFLLASLLEVESPRDAVRTWPLGVVLALTHILPLSFFFASAGLATLARPRALVARAMVVAAPALTLVPWLVRSLRGSHGDSGAVYDPVDVRLASLFKFTLGSGPVADSAMLAEGVAFVVLVLLPLLFFLLPQQRARAGRFVAAAPFVAALLLYFFLPLEVVRPVTHWGTYPRFATLILLGGLFLPDPRLSGRRALALVPVVIAGLWTSSVVAAQFRAFDAEIAPFYQVMRLVPEGARVLPLCQENKFSSARANMGEALYGYITAKVGGFDPYLFDAPTSVVHYRNEARLPMPGSFGRQPALFSMKAHGQFYDYLLVLGLAGDPVAKNPRFESKTAVKIFEGGRFRLYKVE